MSMMHRWTIKAMAWLAIFGGVSGAAGAQSWTLVEQDPDGLVRYAEGIDADGALVRVSYTAFQNEETQTTTAQFHKGDAAVFVRGERSEDGFSLLVLAGEERLELRVTGARGDSPPGLTFGLPNGGLVSYRASHARASLQGADEVGRSLAASEALGGAVSDFVRTLESLDAPRPWTGEALLGELLDLADIQPLFLGSGNRKCYRDCWKECDEQCAPDCEFGTTMGFRCDTCMSFCSVGCAIGCGCYACDGPAPGGARTHDPVGL